MSDRIQTAMAGGMHPLKAAPGLARKPRRLAAALAACVFGLCFWAAPARAEITFLNSWGSYGSGDGEFDGPVSVAVSPAGEVYVVDTRNHRIQKFDSSGGFLTKWGSLGFGDGQFYEPFGVAVSPAGEVYVADTNNDRIQKFDGSGGFLTSWGGAALFDYPRCVAVSPAGEVYVADAANHRIQKFDASGGFLTKWGSEGSGDGQFYWPNGVAVSPAGEVYVADTSNERIQKFDASGGFLTRWGSLGIGDGQFYEPFRVAVSAAGEVYVADTYNHRIQKFDASGSFLTKWGSVGIGDGQFVFPHGMAVSATGYVYVADGGDRIQRFFDSDAWASGTNYFDNAGVGTGELLGPSLALDPARGLVVANTLKVWGTGTVNLQGGALTAGTIDHTAGGAFNFTGGRLQVGTFMGNLTNNGGTLAPGGPVGTTTIQGSYTQTAAGTLEIGLAGTAPGTEHDVLEVTGAASLDGTLAILRSDNFTPQVGDEFEIMTYASRTGEFASTEGWQLLNNLALVKQYETAGLTLTATYHGDATLDFCVDGLDYVAWSNNYKQHNKQWQDGDYTGEGYVDGLDYVIWSNNYQQGCPGVPGAVPEPASALVLALGALALLRRRRCGVAATATGAERHG